MTTRVTILGPLEKERQKLASDVADAVNAAMLLYVAHHVRDVNKRVVSNVCWRPPDVENTRENRLRRLSGYMMPQLHPRQDPQYAIVLDPEHMLQDKTNHGDRTRTRAQLQMRVCW